MEGHVEPLFHTHIHHPATSPVKSFFSHGCQKLRPRLTGVPPGRSYGRPCGTFVSHTHSSPYNLPRQIIFRSRMQKLRPRLTGVPPGRSHGRPCGTFVSHTHSSPCNLPRQIIFRSLMAETVTTHFRCPTWQIPWKAMRGCCFAPTFTTLRQSLMGHFSVTDARNFGHTFPVYHLTNPMEGRVGSLCHTHTHTFIALRHPQPITFPSRMPETFTTPDCFPTHT